MPSTTPTTSPTQTITTAPTNTPAPSATPEPRVCAPLQGISLTELISPELLKNPFAAPAPGMDDGHHGADFAYWSRPDHPAMAGHAILSVLNARIAGVLANRPPYGNAVILETRFEDLPAAWREVLPKILPVAIPTAQPIPNLACPALDANQILEQADPSNRSLYLLYAHMQSPSPLQAGMSVVCGGEVGAVGTTGMSVNNHLHLEMRYGPSGANYAAMAHYDTGATEIERSSYCLWRVSGVFTLVDPVSLLSLQP